MNQQGLITCTRYAFPPNALHYCGPEEQVNIKAYQKEQIADNGLKEIIEKFETLYPYLTLIAYENNIRDPFDPRVVEAYWIGNDLLTNVSMNKFYYHLRDTLKLKKKVKPKDLELLFGKLDDGMLPHHTFHVLNVFTRTGHHSVQHTLETMDACRIGWGTVIQNSKFKIQNDNEKVKIKTKPLVFENEKLVLGKSVIRTINVPVSFIQNTKYKIPNTTITFHWNTLCDIISEGEARHLEWYTQQAIDLANKTI